MAKVDFTDIPKKDDKPSNPYIQKSNELNPKPKKKKITETLWWDMLFGDNENSVKHYVIYDIAIPGFKALLGGAVQSAQQAALDNINSKFGTHIKSAIIAPSTRAHTGTDYASAYRKQAWDRTRNTRETCDGGLSILSYPDEEFAQDILREANELIGAYGSVSKSQVCDIIGQLIDLNDELFFPTTEFPRPVPPIGWASWNRYGWVSLSQAHVVQTQNGFRIIWPPQICLD